MLTYGFLENRVVYKIMSKNMVEPEEPQMTSQYGAYELHASYASLHTCMRMQTPTRLSTRTHARTHTQICDTYCFFTATMVHQHASVLRYVYIVCLVFFL